MPTTNDRLAKLKQQQEEIARKIKQEQAKIAGQQRKEDTRRKIIAGALALEHAERDPEFGNTLQSLFNRFITRNQDRALFDLPSLPAAESSVQTQSTAETAPAANANTQVAPSETPAYEEQSSQNRPGMSGLFSKLR